MKISLDELRSNGIIKRRYEDSSLMSGLGYESEQPIEIIFSLKLQNDYISLEFNVKGEASLACDRCNERFKYTLNFSDKKRINISDFGDMFELTPHIRDVIVISMPLKTLCKESCNGLCQKCGKNLNLEKCECIIEGNDNIDFRLLKLKEFKIKDK